MEYFFSKINIYMGKNIDIIRDCRLKEFPTEQYRIFIDLLEPILLEIYVNNLAFLYVFHTSIKFILK